MSLFPHYLQTAQTILDAYKGDLPFSIAIKQFFAGQKKYGSRDRKIITQLCYGYFRPGKGLALFSTSERIIAGFFLCSRQPHPFLEFHHPLFNASVSFSVYEKLQLLNQPHLNEEIFPWPLLLSDGIEASAFGLSHLNQPHLFVRVRPSQMSVVIECLQNAGIPVLFSEGNCLALPNGAAIHDVLPLNKSAVVQDYCSQQVGNLVKLVFDAQQFKPGHIWDCCAASGGKTIMMRDLYPKVMSTVSDIRPSILHNLKLRFAEAGLKHYTAFIADLAGSSIAMPPFSCDVLIADVPCTGSGTWARTPEQLFYFNPEKIGEFADRQLAICLNGLSRIQSGGYLIYITCSVFKEENEGLVAKLIATQNDLSLVFQKAISGVEKQADSMFLAVLKKS